MARPNISDFPEYFTGYIDKVPGDDLLTAFENQDSVILKLLASITEQQSVYAYAPGKWTIKDMMQHIIDAERIFAYRAVCIARKEKASLPSFEENEYADNAEANKRTWLSLCNEFINVRRSTRDLFGSFSDNMLQQRGKANNREMTVLSLGFISIGHVYHHMNVLKERYLNTSK